MVITLKNNLMADEKRKAAVEKVAQVAARHAAKLKEARNEVRLALAALTVLSGALDEHDTAIDAMSGADMTRQQMTRNTLRANRLGMKAGEIQSQIFRAERNLQDAVSAVGALGGELLTALQEYEFSKQADAPLPIRAQRQAERS